MSILTSCPDTFSLFEIVANFSVIDNNTLAAVLYLSISLVFIVLVLPKLACWFTWFSLGQKAEECIVELHKLHEFILALLDTMFNNAKSLIAQSTLIL